MEHEASSKNALGKGNKSGKGRRSWNAREEEVLLQALKEAIVGGWKSENGFRCGYLGILENAMKKVFPDTDLRGHPHINSKVHVWKRIHGTLVTMLSKSGIGWNETEKTIDASNEAWESFIKNDPSARTMRHKSWPYYNDWCEIFGNDRAAGEQVTTFSAAVQGILNMNDDTVPQEVDLEEIFRNVEGAGESMSVANPSSFNASGSKKSISKKRNKHEHGDELFIDAINNFTDMARETMLDMVKRFGCDYEILKAKKDVFDALGKIPELTMDERMVAADILIQKQNKLIVFFSLPDEARLKFMRKVMNGD